MLTLEDRNKDYLRNLTNRIVRVDSSACPYVAVAWLEKVFDCIQQSKLILSEELQELITSTKAWMHTFGYRSEEVNQDQNFLNLADRWQKTISTISGIYALNEVIVLLFKVISGEANLAEQMMSIESHLRKSETGQRAFESFELQLSIALDVLAAERSVHIGGGGSIRDRLYTLYSRKEEFRDPETLKRYNEARMSLEKP